MLTAFMLYALLSCAASAQSWETVDNFCPGNAGLCGMAQDPKSKAIYAVGYSDRLLRYLVRWRESL